jgi:hypothetical protein
MRRRGDGDSLLWVEGRHRHEFAPPAKVIGWIYKWERWCNPILGECCKWTGYLSARNWGNII